MAVDAFTYRLPRLSVRLPVAFQTDTLLVAGHTANLSDTGLLVTFTEPVLPGTFGLVHLQLSACRLALHARVTHAEFLQAGLTFEFTSGQERAFLQDLLLALAREPQRT